MGGYSTDNTGATETWNGSAWSETADMNTVRRNMTGNVGTTTSTIVAGGKASPTLLAVSESWNGSSWSETADLNDARETIFQT